MLFRSGDVRQGRTREFLARAVEADNATGTVEHHDQAGRGVEDRGDEVAFGAQLRLQALEAALGVRLLLRSTHSMRLTPDGERALVRAKELLGSWAAFESELRGGGDEPTGALRVVAPHAFGQERLIGPLVHYLRRHPQVKVDMRISNRVVDLVEEGIDVALRVRGTLDDSGSLVVKKLGESNTVLVASPLQLERQGKPNSKIGRAHV